MGVLVGVRGGAEGVGLVRGGGIRCKRPILRNRQAILKKNHENIGKKAGLKNFNDHSAASFGSRMDDIVVEGSGPLP